MSVLIGIPSRSIRYLNIHKEGKDNTENCSVDARWTSPLVEKQDNYLVAITRFEVPMNRVPITQALTNCIEIYKYSETHPASFTAAEKATYHTLPTDQNLEDSKLDSGEDMEEWLKFWEKKVPAVETVSVEACHTVYSFINTLNGNINKKLLGYERATPRIVPRGLTTNLFTYNNDDAANMTVPNAYFAIRMNADFTFRVEMNHKFADMYYIKMSQALFNMLGFKEGPEVSGFNFRMNFRGRRFMGSRSNGLTAHPPFVSTPRKVMFQLPSTHVVGQGHQGLFGTNPGSSGVTLKTSKIAVA